jgi:hypothetical protein
MCFIAFVAIAIAGVRAADELLTALVLGLTVLVLSTATLVAVHQRGTWAGFALFGWVQFLMCQPHAAPAVGPTSVPNYVVCRLLTALPTGIPVPGPEYPTAYPNVFRDATGNRFVGATGISVDVPIGSLRAALCLSCILAGLVGAVIGGWVSRHEANRESRPTGTFS